jgi:geranylgeranyl pyrophosphate synthase
MICGRVLGGKATNLIHPACAIELLHNFSLVHDDIMDNDEFRRGQPTVHTKWDLGTAILAGDGLLGLAYRKLLYTPNISDTRLVARFTETMLEICEGQALDKMFETRAQVSEPEYMEMIRKKTAILISISCEFGGIVAQADENQVKALAEFGHNVGMGFQIQDDLLDILADEQVLGKKVGSDLAMNKKTIVSILLHKKSGGSSASVRNISEYQELIRKFDIIKDVEKLIEKYFSAALKQFSLLPENSDKQLLNFLIYSIRQRDK